MGWPVCNVTLTKVRSEYDPSKTSGSLAHQSNKVDEDPILFNQTFHRLGLIVGSVFAVIAALISSWLIFMHATHYTRPAEQKKWVDRHLNTFGL